MSTIRRLDDMSLEELWELFPIVLTDYNPEWQSWASEEISMLKAILEPVDAAYHHIGSTAIKGIQAKPIIDIIIAVEIKPELQVVKDKLTTAGYICMSESPNRISLNKGYTSAGYAERVFHIHLRVKGDTDETYFRDYLNGHPDVAKAYETLKLELSKIHKYNRDAYTQSKTQFVKYYTDLAKSCC